MTPKEFLISYVKKFNAGDTSYLISLYETEACFVSQAGEVVKGIENIRQRLQSFINMNGKIDSKVNGVIHLTISLLQILNGHSTAADLTENQLLLLGKLQMYYVNNQMALGEF